MLVLTTNKLESSWGFEEKFYLWSWMGDIRFFHSLVLGKFTMLRIEYGVPNFGQVLFYQAIPPTLETSNLRISLTYFWHCPYTMAYGSLNHSLDWRIHNLLTVSTSVSDQQHSSTQQVSGGLRRLDSFHLLVQPCAEPTLSFNSSRCIKVVSYEVSAHIHQQNYF